MQVDHNPDLEVTGKNFVNARFALFVVSPETAGYKPENIKKPAYGNKIYHIKSFYAIRHIRANRKEWFISRPNCNIKRNFINERHVV